MPVPEAKDGSDRGEAIEQLVPMYGASFEDGSAKFSPPQAVRREANMQVTARSAMMEVSFCFILSSPTVSPAVPIAGEQFRPVRLDHIGALVQEHAPALVKPFLYGAVIVVTRSHDMFFQPGQGNSVVPYKKAFFVQFVDKRVLPQAVVLALGNQLEPYQVDVLIGQYQVNVCWLFDDSSVTV